MLDNNNTTIPTDNNNTPIVIEEYNHQEKVQDFLQVFNTEILKHKNDVFIKNASELNSLTNMIIEYQHPIEIPGFPLIPKPWFDNNVVKELAINTKQNFEDLNNPETNSSLNTNNIVTTNIEKIKGLLSQSGTIQTPILDSIKNPEDLINNISLPDGFDTNKIMALLTEPNLELSNMEELTSKLGLQDFAIDVPDVNIPNLPPLDLNGIITGGMSGLNFNKMQKSITKDMMKEFPEGTDWAAMCKFNAQSITKAVMAQLSKMTFYIEPGEIKVLTNGAPSTHSGNNINRIKIKLKA